MPTGTIGARERLVYNLGNGAGYSVREVVEKYADVSPFVILKADVQRRGVVYTDRALAQVDHEVHLTQVRTIFHTEGENNVSVPASLLLRDGKLSIRGWIALASRDSRRVAILVWHYHDDDVPGFDLDFQTDALQLAFLADPRNEVIFLNRTFVNVDDRVGKP